MDVRVARMVHERPGMHRALLSSVLVLAACSTGGGSPECSDLAAALAACGLDETAALSLCESTDPEEVEAASTASCTELDDGGKADGLGLTDRTEGQWCLLSSQCADGLVCRPTLSFVNACLPPGLLGEHCWVSSHCADGLICHWIPLHEIPGLPPHPGRVCNPHSDEDHPHQLDGT